MDKMLTTFKSSMIRPINKKDSTYSVYDYYVCLSDYDRLSYDTNSSRQKSYTYIRHFPITATEEDRKRLKQLKGLCQTFADICAVAPYSVKVPKCCRCCVSGKARSSCGFFYKLLFGETKQMGIVLKNTFDAQHIWIKTKDGVKLDCMLFAAPGKKQIPPSTGEDL